MYRNMSSNQQSLTNKERAYLSDALQMENLAWTKYNVYAEQCEDREIKSLLFSISKNKRQHADQITQMLNSSSSSSNNYYQ
jgi:rubrerythrin